MKVKTGGFGEIIPRFQVAVFDEAHVVEEIAATYLGERLSTHQLRELTSDFNKGIKTLAKKERGRIQKALDMVHSGAEEMGSHLINREDKAPLDEDLLSRLREGPGQSVMKGLKTLGGEGSREKGNPGELQPLIMRAGDLYQRLDLILKRRGGLWLNWYEKRKKTVVFHSTPLDVSSVMNERLYGKTHSTILTSATLSTNGTFDYIRSRLGLIETAHEGIYPSHFKFETQSLIYIPRDLPPPSDPGFGASVARRVVDIVKRSRGRALVLFTSYYNLNLVWQMVRDQLPFCVLRQGDAPRSVLLETFKRDISSVLMATGAFWQGVDIPGEALSCLIIDKLPFASPGEPLVAAKIEALRKGGGNPFLEYQVPSAIITFKQGMGRLIRNSADRGVMAILDGRIMTSRYGRRFLESMPGVPRTHDLSAVSRFFKKGPAASHR
ncbi:MAG: ATP-dependent DNA helicase [Deltaproteobacteria bacterium]|nr:ATP-dependent DNA helicase [Deltaproteobacteria bacterium]